MSSFDDTAADNVSSGSGSMPSENASLTEDQNYTIGPDTAFQDAINNLDDLSLEPDTKLPDFDGDEDGTDNGEQDSENVDNNSEKAESDKSSEATGETISAEPGKVKKEGIKAKTMTLFNRLKKLTKIEKATKKKGDTNLSKFHGVKVDKLPVCFVAKYIGHKETKGVFGLEHVREPVDDLIAKVKDDLVSMDRVELPLCYLVFSSRGIDVREHPSNRMHDAVQFGLHPIDFISYGVQDMKYWRVFTFIVVYELGYKKKRSECHVFIADSSQNARKMALALAACFSVYKRKLTAAGKQHNFQVELRPPDELSGELQEEEA